MDTIKQVECPRSPSGKHIRGAGAFEIRTVEGGYDLESRCFYCNQALPWDTIYV